MSRKLFSIVFEEAEDSSYKEPLEVDKLLDSELDAKDKSDKDITYNDQKFNDDIKEEASSDNESGESSDESDMDNDESADGESEDEDALDTEMAGEQ